MMGIMILHNEKVEKWLSECPFPIISQNEGEYDMRMAARFVGSLSHEDRENTTVVVSLDIDLKKLVEYEKMENNNVIAECIQIAKKEWNSGADVYNQWQHLPFEEKMELVMDEVYKEIRNELQNFGLENFGNENETND